MSEYVQCPECGEYRRPKRMPVHRFIHMRDAQFAAAGGPTAFVEQRMTAKPDDGYIPMDGGEFVECRECGQVVYARGRAFGMMETRRGHSRWHNKQKATP